MHWTPLGKVILAHLPVEKRNEIVADYRLPNGTDNTLSSRSDLEAALE
jgi:DNA-binding IclR family transcriptional regulator